MARAPELQWSTRRLGIGGAACQLRVARPGLSLAKLHCDYQADSEFGSESEPQPELRGVKIMPVVRATDPAWGS